MREIKFRIWDKINKKMNPHTEGFISQHGNLLFDLDPTGINMNGSKKIGFKENHYQFAGLYTGLLDIKGKEIYEGDIIIYNLAPGLGQPNQTGLKREVKYSPYGFFGNWDNNIIVIGNIHESPELLNQ